MNRSLIAAKMFEIMSKRYIRLIRNENYESINVQRELKSRYSMTKRMNKKKI